MKKLNLEQIASLTLSNLQMLLDNLRIPLAVGPIKDEDFRLLTSGYAELDWDYGFSAFGNRDDKFEFCLKLLSGPLQHIPSGAAMCTYDQDSGVISVRFVESFVRGEKDNPLYGKMFIITLWAVYLFGNSVDCKEVHIPDAINKKVMAHYQKYGFEGDLTLLTASFASIGDVIRSYIKTTS